MKQAERDLRARGSRHGAARLNEVQAREIRDRYARGGETFASLAEAYSVSPQTIAAIIHRRSWRHVL